MPSAAHGDAPPAFLRHRPDHQLLTRFGQRAAAVGAARWSEPARADGGRIAARVEALVRIGRGGMGARGAMKGLVWSVAETAALSVAPGHAETTVRLVKVLLSPGRTEAFRTAAERHEKDRPGVRITVVSCPGTSPPSKRQRW